jgi:simple sugar transport system permease protein
VGLLAAMVVGLLAGLLMGWLAVTLGLNQHVSGLGVTLLTSGIALFFFRLLFKGTANPPKIAPFQQLSLPGLGVLAPILEQYGLTYFAFLLVPLAWWVLHRTTFGLWIRSVGENPQAADTAGVNVAGVRYAALAISGVLMGLGGSFLSLAQLGTATFGIVAGRGWVAIALVIFGNWQPGRVLLGALLFGGVEALQLRLRAVGVNVPYQLLLSLPYLATIAALALAGRNAAYPAALLKPYKREE